MMLTLKGLESGYGDTPVLRDIDLRVGEGEIAALLGRNGVGKTTLLQTIMGLVRTRRGSIFLNGEEITRDPPEKRAKRGIAYVPQGRGIFPQLTVQENLLLGLEALPEKTDRIPGEIYDLFPILPPLLRRSGGDLSGGQQQQLAIARALLSQPRFLLLDEPTEGIQPNIVEEIEEVIRTLKGEHHRMSILLVEQNLDFAFRLADSLCVLEKGTVAAAGRAGTVDEETIQRYLVV